MSFVLRCSFSRSCSHRVINLLNPNWHRWTMSYSVGNAINQPWLGMVYTTNYLWWWLGDGLLLLYPQYLDWISFSERNFRALSLKTQTNEPPLQVRSHRNCDGHSGHRRAVGTGQQSVQPLLSWFGQELLGLSAYWASGTMRQETQPERFSISIIRSP